MAASTPFHTLPLQQQAELVLDTSYFGTYEAERGNRADAEFYLGALEDMAEEARLRDSPAARAIAAKAASSAQAIRNRLTGLDMAAALRSDVASVAGWLLLAYASGFAGWHIGGLL